MTETSPLGSVCRVKSALLGRSDEELADVRSTQGIVTPLMECRIVEPGTADELPWDGEARGELQVAGPWVAAGYYNDERETELVHRRRLAAHRRRRDDHARRLHPARRPHEGPRQVRRRMDLLGRARERDHGPPAGASRRRSSACPTSKWGERPLACVVAEDGAELDADSLREFLTDRVAKWWIPEQVEFIDEVPKTSVGKFSKKTLRERFS